MKYSCIKYTVHNGVEDYKGIQLFQSYTNQETYELKRGYNNGTYYDYFINIEYIFRNITKDRIILDCGKIADLVISRIKQLLSIDEDIYAADIYNFFGIEIRPADYF